MHRAAERELSRNPDQGVRPAPRPWASFVMTMTLRCVSITNMTTTSNRPAPRGSLNLRIKPELRGLIDRAAQLAGKNRTDFVLEAARRAAEEALLDRTVFTVSPEAYAEFLARLDAPPQPNERLRRTMQTAAPWDRA